MNTVSLNANIEEALARQDPEAIQYVFLNGWETGSDLILTQGAASCVVLGAHNRQTGQGLVGHFAVDTTGDAKFDEALQYVPELGPVRSTGIVLAGVVIEYSRGETVDIRGARHAALDRVIDSVPRIGRIQEVWNNEANTVMDGLLNCRNGDFLIGKRRTNQPLL